MVGRGLAGTVSWHWFGLPSFATHQISLLNRVNGRLPYSPGIRYQIARLIVPLVILLVFIFIFIFHLGLMSAAIGHKSWELEDAAKPK